jgi:tetratricopeptide (TPR) repeat protein
LKAQDYPLARLILNRALELSPSNSAIEGMLGVTFLFSNDLENAAAAFKQALKHNPKEATAAWGLASMYSQFGFKSRYKGLAASAKAAGRPSGVLHPWMETILSNPRPGTPSQLDF